MRDLRVAGDGEWIGFSRGLFPDLAERLDRALGENARRDGALADDALAGDTVQPGRAFDDRLDAEVARRHELREAITALADISDPAVRARFEDAFATARSIFAPIGCAVPEPESFLAAGIDLRSLATAAARDTTLAVVVAPHGLGAAAWLSLFDGAARDDASAGRPGLVLADEVRAGFDALDRPPRAAPAASVRDRLHPSAVWTLRLIPASDAPPLMGLGHAHGPHATLSEMLVLQLRRADAGCGPLDAETFTWVAGELAGGALAAREVFDESERAVRISARGVGSQGPHLGARPPVG
ncbi:hypothetical protein J4H92_12985 [Leucobacter weissii]|uniref:Uncharacterized protein n=1 Tax=Leucobacter weissii TaxID=1983706 RepID=A0A939SCW6_9MICO|nr:hypothetical protein [Leucobacter weissii]MBO1902860.1 hypothetical protein [Leucobacter weissii]